MIIYIVGLTPVVFFEVKWWTYHIFLILCWSEDLDATQLDHRWKWSRMRWGKSVIHLLGGWSTTSLGGGGQIIPFQVSGQPFFLEVNKVVKIFLKGHKRSTFFSLITYKMNNFLDHPSPLGGHACENHIIKINECIHMKLFRFFKHDAILKFTWINKFHVI